MLQIGKNGGYDWLVTDHPLEQILRVCPELVVGKYLAVTSCDSGPLGLNPEDITAGWESRNEVAYSQQISDTGCIPRDQYDEWYIFDRQTDIRGMVPGEKNIFDVRPQTGQVSAFVNFFGFAFHDPNMDDLTKLFWQQIDWIRPESYVANGTRLNIASRDANLFARIELALRSLEPH